MTPKLQPAERGQRHLGLTAVVVAVFVCHLAYSTWFWTKSPTDAAKTSLRSSGEAFLASYVTWNSDGERDAACYNRSALEVLRTGVPRYRSGGFFDHAPLYSYFLAGCYWVGGICLLAFAIPQAALSALTALFVGLSAGRLRRQNLVGASVVAAGLILIHLRLAGAVAYPAPQPVVLFLFALLFWSAACVPPEQVPWLGVAAAGLAIFSYASFFLIAGAVVFWLLWRFVKHHQAANLVAAGVVAVCALVKVGFGLAPGDEFRTAAQSSLWIANNPYYENVPWWGLWEMRYTPEPRFHISAEQERRFADYLARSDGNGSKAGLLWVRENPGQYAKMCFVRFRAVLGPVTGHMKNRANRLLSTAHWLLVFPAGFYGLWRLRRLEIAKLALLIIVIQAAFEALVFAGLQHRYRLPIDLMLAAFAGGIYAAWLARLVDRFKPAPAPTAHAHP